MDPHPPGDALLLPADVAEWLDVDRGWVERTAAQDGLPCDGDET